MPEPKFKLGDIITVKLEGQVIRIQDKSEAYDIMIGKTGGGSIWVSEVEGMELKLKKRAEVIRSKPKFKEGDRVVIKLDGVIQFLTMRELSDDLYVVKTPERILFLRGDQMKLKEQKNGS